MEAHQDRPTLYEKVLNLLFENLTDEHLQFRAVFHPPTQRFLQDFLPMYHHKFLHRQDEANEMVDVLTHAPELSISPYKDRYLALLLAIIETYPKISREHLAQMMSKVSIKKRISPWDDHWQGQNHPIHVMSPNGHVDALIPLMARFFDLDDDDIFDFLEPPESYGWGDEFMNAMAWAMNSGDVMDFTPGSRYGSIPDWFPTKDRQGREISEQAQVDRFLLLVASAYGGFIGDHINVEPYKIAQGIRELRNDWGTYLEFEEGIEWELAEDGKSESN